MNHDEIKNVEETVAWINSGDHLTSSHMRLFDAYLLCFGDFPDMRLSEEAVKNRLTDFADGYRYAQDE